VVILKYENCGETYLGSEINQVLFKQAEHELRRGIFLEMVNYKVDDLCLI